MKAYLEKIGPKEWLDDFVYISRQPLEDLGYEISAFDGSDTSKLWQTDFERQDILIGSVESTIIFFQLMNVPIPGYIGYPDCIRKYLGREIRKTKFMNIQAEIQTLPCEYPFFIKPADDVKKFTGCVIEKKSEIDTLEKFENIEDEDIVYISEVLDIISEYRCFVHRGVLKGIQWYKGDFCKFPEVELIKNIIKDYKNAPVAYTIDIGILSNGSNILVEINDFWAIGSYGLSGKIYARMAADRFRQIMKSELL
jgi:hypothetical protein